MKVAVTLLLSLVLPLPFMGLAKDPHSYAMISAENRDTQNIAITGPEITIERENFFYDVQYPVLDSDSITSDYGYRFLANCSTCSTYHQGVDFVPGHGTPVYAIMDGVVVDAGWDGSFGMRVVIRHKIFDGLEYTTIYAHLQDSFITDRLRTGQEVSKGFMLGLVGNTGRSTGSHLHFEIHENQQVLDPLEFFDFHIKD